MLTGFSEAITREKAKALGIREFLLKPILRRDLAKAVEEALAGEAMRRHLSERGWFESTELAPPEFYASR